MASLDNAEKELMVSKQTCFSKLNSEELRELATLLTEKEYSVGDEIVHEGDVVDSVFIIVEGEADVRHIYYQDGQPHFNSLATLHPGQAIGLSETGFYSLSGLRTATVIANTKMKLLQLSVPAFHGYALSHSRVNAIMRQNAETIPESNQE